MEHRPSNESGTAQDSDLETVDLDETLIERLSTFTYDSINDNLKVPNQFANTNIDNAWSLSHAAATSLLRDGDTRTLVSETVSNLEACFDGEPTIEDILEVSTTAFKLLKLVLDKRVDLLNEFTDKNCLATLYLFILILLKLTHHSDSVLERHHEIIIKLCCFGSEMLNNNQVIEFVSEGCGFLKNCKCS
jgi:hypothetical protein